jgi:hypothetical protein
VAAVGESDETVDGYAADAAELACGWCAVLLDMTDCWWATQTGVTMRRSAVSRENTSETKNETRSIWNAKNVRLHTARHDTLIRNKAIDLERKKTKSAGSQRDVRP